jgi:N-acetylglucosaminyl-diphospho-decaprenol L-rhamnosyltransferase
LRLDDGEQKGSAECWRMAFHVPDQLPPGPILSVWIVNYNSVDCLAQCIPGLNSERIRRIVVLDNASAQDDRNKLREMAAADPRITVIFSDTNVGFGAGHNRIAALTGGDVVPGELIWILNPDTVVTSPATERLYDAVASGRADIVSPVILYGRPEDPVFWFAGGRIETRNVAVTHTDAGRAAPVDSGPDVVSTEFVTGAAPLMSRATWDDLGGFRDDLFLYWEDVDLSLRARRSGKRLAVVRTAKIWHAEGGSSGGGSGATAAHTYYYSARNRIVVCSSFTGATGLAVGRGLPVLLRLAGSAFLKGRGHRVANVWAVVQGTVDGIRGRTGPRVRG